VRAGCDGPAGSGLWFAAMAIVLASCAGPRGGTAVLATGPAAWDPSAAAPAGAPASSSLRPPRSSGVLVFVVDHSTAPDTACFRQAAGWEAPEEVLLADPVRRYHFLGLIHWVMGKTPEALQAAGSEVEQRLGLDRVDLYRAELRLRKDYGRRLSLFTNTGLGASAEDALEADYRLWRNWYVRSETRERGESFLELRREILFR
jgi:hypothetical protein